MRGVPQQCRLLLGEKIFIGAVEKKRPALRYEYML